MTFLALDRSLLRSAYPTIQDPTLPRYLLHVGGCQN